MKPKLEDMHPNLFSKFLVMKALAKDAKLEYGKNWILNAVLRTVAEQQAYYVQGRTIESLAKHVTLGRHVFQWRESTGQRGKLVTIEFINWMRREAGMSPIGPSDANVIVTKTLNSRHFPSVTGHSRAFDVIVLKPGMVPTWDIKWDGDKDSIGDYLELARLGQKVGLVAGAFWKSFHDWPHFELPGDII